MSKSRVEVIVSDIHHRISGVGATIRTLLPIMNSQIKLRLVSQQSEEGIHTTSIWRLLFDIKGIQTPHKNLVWHARRNNEMFWALLCKHVLRIKMKIIFTSAAKRRHSAYPRWLISKMDAVIATSDEAASYVENVVAVIPHGVNTDRFKPISNESSNKKLCSYGLENKKLIGIFGRVRPEKGTDLFVESMITALHDFPEYHALIVGKTTRKFFRFKSELVRKIEKAGLAHRFIWLDGVAFEDMPVIYQNVKLCIAPARYEGFGLVPLEAMACETAVIASRTGAYEQMVVPGENGMLIPCDDLNALQDAIHHILSDETALSDMAADGKNKVIELFSAKKEAQSIIDEYEKLFDAD